MENRSRFNTGMLGGQEAGQAEASSVIEKARDLGSQAVDKAKDMGAQALEKVKEVGDRAGQTVSQLGERLGETYEAGRHYVTERGVRGMGADVTDLIRRNPLPALLVGLGLGFLIARALRRQE